MVDIDIQKLSLSPLLVGLKPDELQAMVEAAEVVDYRGGEVIVAEGSPGDTMFMLCEGEVVVEKASPATGRPVLLATFTEPGDFFGEMVFVDVMPRSATVRAHLDARLMVFSLETLRRFCEASKDVHLTIVLNIARMLSKRLRKADEMIAGSEGKE